MFKDNTHLLNCRQLEVCEIVLVGYMDPSVIVFTINYSLPSLNLTNEKANTEKIIHLSMYRRPQAVKFQIKQRHYNIYIYAGHWNN